MKGEFFKRFLIGIALLTALSAIVMLLWNNLIAIIFGITTITFWQGFGLFVLARILFGNMPGRRMMGGGIPADRRNPLRDKWFEMTPEQQKEFINKRKEFGFGGPFGRRDFFDRNDRFNHPDEEPAVKNEQ